MGQSAVVQDFFHEDTNTFSYIVSDPATGKCAVIDSVLDYDAASASTSTTHAHRIIAYVREYELEVEWILETHVHADHLTAAQYLHSQLGGKMAMSHHISVVQRPLARSIIWTSSSLILLSHLIICLLIMKHSALVHCRPITFDTGPHTGLSQLCDWGCGLCRRYLVHAGLRHSAL